MYNLKSIQIKTIIFTILLILNFPLLAFDQDFTPEEIEEFEQKLEKEKQKEFKEKLKKDNESIIDEDSYYDKLDDNEMEFEDADKFIEKSGIRKRKKFGINGNIGGSALFGLTMDCFITEYINLEVSFVAFIFPIIVGAKVYLAPKSNSSLYLGIHSTLPGITPSALYIPIGIERINESGFTFSVEGGIAIIKEENYNYYYNNNETSSRVIPWGGIKLGYHF